MSNYFKELKLNTELILLFSSIYITDLAYGIDGSDRVRTPFHLILLSLPILWFVSNEKKTKRFIILNLIIGLPIIFLFILSFLFLPNEYHFIIIKTIPYLVYYLLTITISLTIISTSKLETFIDSSFLVARFSITIGLIFYFISLLTGINFLVDPSGEYLRLSGLGGEPSNMAIPISVGLIYSIIKNKKLFLIVTSFATILTFSLTNYIVFFVTLSSYLLIYNLFEINKNGNLNLTLKKSGILITILLIIIIFLLSINSAVFEELKDNLLNFFLTGQFIDSRALYTYDFYSIFEKLNPRFGFGFASSDMVAKAFNKGRIYDYSIFTTFDMYFGSFIGKLFKLIFLYITLDIFRTLPNYFRKNQVNQLFISLYVIASLLNAVGSFVQPYGLINIIGAIYLRYKNYKK